jgi:hypothetical protein
MGNQANMGGNQLEIMIWRIGSQIQEGHKKNFSRLQLALFLLGLHWKQFIAINQGIPSCA